MTETNLKVIREPYDKKGKTLYAYYVEVAIRSRKVKFQFYPTDNGGYVLLDIVFNGKREATLATEPYEYLSHDGKRLKGISYKAMSRDEDGTEYYCPIRLKRESSRSVLAKYLS